MRRKQKFILVWVVILSLAFAGRGAKLLAEHGYTDLNSLAADALRITPIIALILIPFALWFGIRRSKAQKSSGPRKKRCFKCKRWVDETGPKCASCGWLKCACGACGCSFKK